MAIVRITVRGAPVARDDGWGSVLTSEVGVAVTVLPPDVQGPVSMFTFRSASSPPGADDVTAVALAQAARSLVEERYPSIVQCTWEGTTPDGHQRLGSC